MSITSKYQVTIPKEIRESMHVNSSDRIRFVRDGDRVFIQRVRSISDAQALAQKLMKARKILPQSDKALKNARSIFAKKGLRW